MSRFGIAWLDGARLRHAWDARTAREQALLGILTLLALSAALLLLVVRPLAAERADALLSIRAAASRDARLRAAAAAPMASAAPGDLATIVATSAARSGIGIGIGSPAQRAPGRVTLAAVGYDPLVRWLADLASAGVQVERLRVVRATVPGMVDAELVLVR